MEDKNKVLIYWILGAIALGLSIDLHYPIIKGALLTMGVHLSIEGHKLTK